nr:RNA-directed DNA polymerase, eukaryota [Tanacetum cinerariifolium]
SLASIQLGLASTVVVPEDAPADVSDPDLLSYADAPSRHPVDVAQSSPSIAAAGDPESENASSPTEFRSPGSVYQREWGVTNVAMGSQLRLRFEQEAKLLRKSVAQVARRDKRIHARELEIRNLEASLEAEANAKMAAEDKSAGLKKLKAAFEEFKRQQDERVEQRCAEMDARLDALSIDFDEELYLHMLTAIAGRQWVIGRGLRLAIMKCGSGSAWKAYMNARVAGLFLLILLEYPNGKGVDETSEPLLYAGWMAGPYRCKDATRGRNDDPVTPGPSKPHDQSKKHTDKRPDFQSHSRDGNGANQFTPLTRTPKEILAAEENKFQPPPPMVTPVEKRNGNKFCDFHNDKGHSTNECMQLKKQIEELVWFWDLNCDDVFQVKDVCMLIDEAFLPKVVTLTRWVKSIPIKVNVFAWKLFLDRLPTRSNLARRNINVPSLECLLCNNVPESSSHLFFGCSVAKEVLKPICRLWDLDFHDFDTYDGWLSWFKSIHLGSKSKGVLEGVFYVFWWSIWLYRNQLLFTSSKPRKSFIFDDIVLRSFN